jgi:hypothetical protein
MLIGSVEVEGGVVKRKDKTPPEISDRCSSQSDEVFGLLEEEV